MIFNSGRTTAKRFARTLRKNQTEPEAILWSRLRNRKLAGIKFRRQVPIHGYVADFAALTAHLVIELDGGQHSERSAYDEARSKVFESAGFLVLRFWNSQVCDDLEGVVESIRATMQADQYSAPIWGTPLTWRLRRLSSPHRGEGRLVSIRMIDIEIVELAG